MKKMIAFALAVFGVLTLIVLAGLLRDHQYLCSNVIRLHVVANSDSEQDQNIKLSVRDAVNAYLQSTMRCSNKEEAKQFLSGHMVQLESVANRTLKAQGSSDKAKVLLQEEQFDTRHYDTFSLPAGQYCALRINIGEAEGENWWCVIFPSLCVPADPVGLADITAAAGFDVKVCDTIGNNDQYELRFYFLDLVGKIRNFLK